MADNNLKRCQDEADEVQVIMLDNFNKVMDREGKLSELDERAEELRNQSSAFCKTTKTVARQEQWRNMKWKIILGVVIVAVLLILLGILIYFLIPGPGDQEAASKTSAGGN
ncbi:vesicle-associated membrane protein 5 [Tiliqua scincoides]|uniref:vesicle-associated membrane protein 5 n=1 Tax=Tiliqua scincoides TaxID=71010 RepID=UPI00346215DD